MKPQDKVPFERETEEGLDKIARYDIPAERGQGRDGDWRERALKRFKNAQQVNEFLVSEVRSRSCRPARATAASSGRRAAAPTASARIRACPIW
ncbi:MAG: hypothetical protein U1E76_16550 [Planctomycetota bacterium]